MLSRRSLEILTKLIPTQLVADWGITNDGNCANVQSLSILITTINDIIAPVDEDFNIAADRIYFNRDYIAQEITRLTTQEFYIYSE